MWQKKEESPVDYHIHQKGGFFRQLHTQARQVYLQGFATRTETVLSQPATPCSQHLDFLWW